MRKQKRNSTRGSGPGRWLAISSLAVTLAAFGCTTNQYPGNGQPTMNPEYGPAPHAVTPGSSSGNVPMSSSFTTNAHVDVDAIAAAAADQAFQGQVLGLSGAQGVQTELYTEPTGGQVVNPARIANPQVTVNSSVYSPATPAYGVAGGSDAGALFVAPNATAPATIAASPLSVTGAIGVGAMPASGTTVPATTAFSPAISGVAAVAPTVAQGTIVGTTRPAPATIANSSSLAVNGAVGVGAPPPSGTTVPATTAFSPTLSGNAALGPVVASGTIAGTTQGAPAVTGRSLTLSPVTLNPPMASSSAPLVLTNTANARIAQRSRAAGSIVLPNALSATAAAPVRIVTGTSGKVTITNVKK